MLKKTNFLVIVLCLGMGANSFAQNESDSLGLAGDNLDLYGVLELFKKSENPEAFEKALNSEDNGVNNLDLNGDGEIDYIRVTDQSEGDAHALVLQVPFSETEAQDVAVIEIEKSNAEIAQVQIIGDEDLYGKDYIVEPSDDAPSNRATTSSKTVVVVNVWAWPSIKYMYGPKYVVWRSPWKWKHYPAWWKPWKPVAWHIHHKRAWHYHTYYRPVYVYRIPNAHKVYHAHRVVSVSYKRRAAHPVKKVVKNKKPAPKKKK